MIAFKPTPVKEAQSMPRVVHFDIQADDTGRAKKFYGDVFDWEFADKKGLMEYYSITTGPDKEHGINGGLAKRDKQSPTGSTIAFINTISVPSVDDYTEKITQAGGKITMPRMAISGGGWHAQFKDTEGNIFGIVEDGPNAK